MNTFIKLEENTKGEDYVVGDIHGCHDKLWDAMERVSFDPAKDRLLSVGDIVDRGSDSFSCLTLLTLPWFKAVRGNHEQMMLDFVKYINPETLQFDYTKDYNAGHVQRMWYINGGEWYEELPVHQKKEVLRICNQHVVNLPYAIEVKRLGYKFGIIHAEWLGNWRMLSADGYLDNCDSAQYCLLWQREYAQKHYLPSRVPECQGVDWLIAGHTPLKEVAYKANRAFIDTGAFRHDGKLTIISLKELTERLIDGRV
jgi:serine/threonine protein phosphatase 1